MLQKALRSYYARVDERPSGAQREMLLSALTDQYPTQVKACNLTSARLRKWFDNHRSYTTRLSSQSNKPLVRQTVAESG